MKFLFIVRDAWLSAIIFSLLPQIVHGQINWIGINLAFAFGIGYALGFAVNNYYDSEIDALDPDKAKYNYFVSHNISKSKIYLILVIIYSYLVFVFWNFRFEGLLILFLLSFIIWGYSTKPFHFKQKIGFDLFIHSVFVDTAPYFVTLYLLDISPNDFDFFMIIVLLLSSLSGQIAGQMRDFDIDMKTHNTTIILLGRRTSRFVYFLVGIALSVVVIIGIVISIIPLFMYPLFAIGAIYLLSRRIVDNKITLSRRYGDVVLGLISLTYLVLISFTIFLQHPFMSFLLSPY